MRWICSSGRGVLGSFIEDLGHFQFLHAFFFGEFNQTLFPTCEGSNRTKAIICIMQITFCLHFFDHKSSPLEDRETYNWVALRWQ